MFGELPSGGNTCCLDAYTRSMDGGAWPQQGVEVIGKRDGVTTLLQSTFVWYSLALGDTDTSCTQNEVDN